MNDVAESEAPVDTTAEPGSIASMGIPEVSIPMPKSLEGTVVGIIAFFIILPLFVLWVRQQQRKQDADGGIDARHAELLRSTMQQLAERDETIQELRARNELVENRNIEINDRYHTATQKYTEQLAETSLVLNQQLETMRQAHAQGMARMAERLTATEAVANEAKSRVDKCEDAHDNCRAEVESLRRLIDIRATA